MVLQDLKDLKAVNTEVSRAKEKVYHLINGSLGIKRLLLELIYESFTSLQGVLQLSMDEIRKEIDE